MPYIHTGETTCDTHIALQHTPQYQVHVTLGLSSHMSSESDICARRPYKMLQRIQRLLPPKKKRASLPIQKTKQEDSDLKIQHDGATIRRDCTTFGPSAAALVAAR